VNTPTSWTSPVGFVVNSTVTISANQAVFLTGDVAGSPITCDVPANVSCFFLGDGASLRLTNLALKNRLDASFRVEAARGSSSTFNVSGGGIADNLQLKNIANVGLVNTGFAANATVSVDEFDAVSITNLTTRPISNGAICPSAPKDRTGGLIFTNGAKVQIVSSSLRDLCVRPRLALMNFTNVDSVTLSDSVVARLEDSAALFCNDCVDLTIKNATFLNVVLQENGVVKFTARPNSTPSKVNVTDSLFEGNRLRAVVLDVVRAAIVNVERTHFRNNIAEISESVAAWISDDGNRVGGANMSVTFRDCTFVGSTSANNGADVLRFGDDDIAFVRGRIGSVELTNLQFVDNSAPTLVRFEGTIGSVVLDSLSVRGNNVTENLVRIQGTLNNLTAQSWCVCAPERVPAVVLLCSTALGRQGANVENVRHSCGQSASGTTPTCTSPFCTGTTSTSTVPVASTPLVATPTAGTSTPLSSSTLISSDTSTAVPTTGSSDTSATSVPASTSGSTTAIPTTTTTTAGGTSSVVAASAGGVGDDGTGVIIGASVGGAIAAVLLVGGVLFFVCRSRKSAAAAAPNSKDKPAAAELKPQALQYAAIVVPPAEYEQGRFDAQSNYAVIAAKSNDNYEHGNVS
jgi:hypothetical protein